MTTTCSTCRTEVASFDTIHVSGQARNVCLPCWNREMAATTGFDFDEVVTEPLTFHDFDGKPHTMHFHSRMSPGGHALEAFELVDGIPGGYRFKVLADMEADGQELFMALVRKISVGLSRRSLDKHDPGYVLPFDRPAFGRIDMDEDGDPRVWVDGRAVSWHAFGQMLLTYEGWGFKLEIVDETGEL